MRLHHHTQPGTQTGQSMLITNNQHVILSRVILSYGRTRYYLADSKLGSLFQQHSNKPESVLLKATESRPPGSQQGEQAPTTSKCQTLRLFQQHHDNKMCYTLNHSHTMPPYVFTGLTNTMQRVPGASKPRRQRVAHQCQQQQHRSAGCTATHVGWTPPAAGSSPVWL